jgi:hypothetical protein
VACEQSSEPEPNSSTTTLSREENERIQSDPSLSDYQRAALADGRLDLAEVIDGHFQTVACVEDLGARITADFPPTLKRAGTFRWEAATANGVSFAEFEACEASFSRRLNEIWARYHRPSEAELNAARERYSNCLSERGVPVTKDSSSVEIFQVRDQWRAAGNDNSAWVTCQRLVEEEFDLPNFGG